MVRWGLALVLVLACAACGSDGAVSTKRPARHHVVLGVPVTKQVSTPAADHMPPIMLPALPAQGFAYAAGHGIVLTDAGGRVLARLPGWRLGGETGLPAGMLALRHAGRFWFLDPGHHEVVAWSGDTDAQPLAGDARIVYRADRRWRLEIGSRVVWSGTGDITPSKDGRLVTAGHIGLDVTDGTRVHIRAGCIAGARRGSTWYVLCGAAHSPWVGIVRRGGRVSVLGQPLGKGELSGWFGWYTSAEVSPDGRTLLLQYSGQCETPNAFFEPVTGGRPQPVTGEADWRVAPESSAIGWTRDGSALVRLLPLACGQGARPGIYAISPGGGMRRLARVNAEPWGRW